MLRFQREQKSFDLKTAGEARETAIFTDDPVAGDHYRNWIAPVGSANCPGFTGVAERQRLLLIAHGLAIGNCRQHGPRAFLESCSNRGEWHFKCPPIASEVLKKLAACRRERRITRVPTRRRRKFDAGIAFPEHRYESIF